MGQLQAGSIGKVRERDGTRVQVVLHPPPLEPRLPDLPHRRVERGRAEDVGRARLPVRRPVEHVRAEVDVVHVRARREAEPEACRFAGAVVRSLVPSSSHLSPKR